jgi:hypothetical protein
MFDVVIVGLTAGLITFVILFVCAFITLCVITFSVRFIVNLFRRLTCGPGTACQEQTA